MPSARILVIALTAFALAQAPTLASAETLSGELVKLDGSASSFRLVGHDGTFTAPAGTPLDELDGRNVVVEVSGGRVVQIVERQVAITPVTSGFETVRGKLVVRDPVVRSFGFASDTRVYVAPASIDIVPYGGQWVEVRLDAKGDVREMKLIAEPAPPVSAPAAPPAAVPPVVDAPSMPQPKSVVSGAATCLIGDASVASGSTVCREGTTAMCNNGSWVNLGTACR